MIQHLHSLLCARPIIDKDTGSPSYIDIIEGVNVRNPEKLLLPPLHLMSRFWIKDKAVLGITLEVEVSVKNSTTKKRVLQVMSHDVDKQGDNVLFHLEINNLIVKETGLWEIEVRWKVKDSKNWKKGTSIPLKVSVNN